MAGGGAGVGVSNWNDTLGATGELTDANRTTTEIKQLWGTNPNLDDSNSARVSGLSGDLAMNFPVRIGPTRHSVSGIQIIGLGGPPVPLSLAITPSDTDDDLYDFTWVSKSNQVYDLVSSPDLSTAPADWPVWEGQGDIAGTGEKITLSDIPGTDSKRFFAIIEKAGP